MTRHCLIVNPHRLGSASSANVSFATRSCSGAPVGRGNTRASGSAVARCTSGGSNRVARGVRVRRKPGLIQCAGAAELHIGNKTYALEDFAPAAHLPDRLGGISFPLVRRAGRWSCRTRALRRDRRLYSGISHSTAGDGDRVGAKVQRSVSTLGRCGCRRSTDFVLPGITSWLPTNALTDHG